MTEATTMHAPDVATRRKYNLFLLAVAGLGGLLYGVDVGIIGGALPYLEATSHLNAAQLSIIASAVLLGSVISTLFAGLIADWIGRKPLMVLSGILFSLSIPMIALSTSYGTLFFGRLLQGTSGGFIGIVIPLYLAECLDAKDRGKGTGVFQWLLTFGIACAAIIGLYFSYRVDAVSQAGNASALFTFKDHAWRSIFWVSLPPGILFTLGALFVAESPRWLYMRGKQNAALASLLRSRSSEQADHELGEIKVALATPATKATAVKESLLRRKYIIPFILACIILACNTGTGVNSVIAYNTNILIQAGLSDLQAHWGYVFFTLVNFLMTIIAVTLVDRKGRKFLLTVGTSGVIVAMLVVGTLFRSTEKQAVDVTAAVQSMVTPNETLDLTFNAATAQKLLASAGNTSIDPNNAAFAVIYTYGDFTASTPFVSTRDNNSAPISAARSALPADKIQAFFTNPFANLDASRSAPLHIQKAILAPVPTSGHGWMIAIWLYVFMSFFAIGPGVCVWLALSELMPTRIRSNGMSIALVLNQVVSTTLAGIFLPVVSKHGYSFMFYLFAGFTVVYFITAAFFLPETKGKTLEEIEKFFEAA